MAFGSIEWITVMCLTHLPVDPVGKTASKLPLAKRVELLVEILAPRADSISTGLLPLLAQIKPLSKIRNQVAHEPLVLSIFYSEATKEFRHGEVIGMTKEGKGGLSFEEVVAWHDQCENLASKLWEVASQIFAAKPGDLEAAAGS